MAQLKWPQLHPHFFAYGHFSIYLAYFLNQLISFAQNLNFLPQVPFPQAAYTLRFLSALESVLLIGVVFLIARKIYSPAAGLIAAALTAFTPGLIQAAHFGTTEAMLTLILFAVLYLSLKLLEKNDPKKNFFYLAVLLGIGLATKINSLVFFSFPLVALTLKTGFRPRKIWQQKNNFFLLGACFILAIIILIIASPYQILEWENFRGTTFYEISVAQGKSPVFYTRQFIDTRPIIFQLLKVFPFALGPFVEISGLAGLVATFLFLKLKKPPFIKKQKLLLVWAFLIYCPVSLLTFTKWTRFIVPLLPFLAFFHWKS